MAVNCVPAHQHLRMWPHLLYHGWEPMLNIVSVFNEFIELYDMIHYNIPLCGSLPLFTGSMHLLSPYHMIHYNMATWAVGYQFRQ